MRILVDADACPVKGIVVEMARQRGIPVLMVTDTSHRIQDGYSQVITVDKGRDSADLRLANEMEPGDIVVTQDFGVAALALGKGCRALNQNGLVFTGQNMDQLLFERYVGQKSAPGRQAHPGPRQEDGAAGCSLPASAGRPAPVPMNRRGSQRWARNVGDTKATPWLRAQNKRLEPFQKKGSGRLLCIRLV